jgi:uncharacterized membrane protein HdeD (DUF308 family)
MNENILIPEFSKNWKWIIVRGILSIIFGIVIVFYPFAAATVLALFFGAYVFVDGIFAIVSIFTLREARTHFWPLLIEGIAGIAVGVLTFLLPEITLYGLALLVSFWAVITGIFEIISAIKLRKIINGEFLMIVSGLLSIVFGILVLLKPLAGIIVTVYLIGMYGIIFGILFIFLGISLKKLHLKSSNL